MNESPSYVIRGGVAGRERLRVLSGVMHETTAALFDRVGIRPGMRCLDVGCGGGDVSIALAQRVAPGGHVCAVDLDETKLDLAREEAAARGVANIEFRRARIGDEDAIAGGFNVVYSRFLLTHLRNPAGALADFHRCLDPGGLGIIEDIDFTGYFTYPDSAAHRRYLELYCAAVRATGADPDIGPKLPGLLKASGFADIGVSVVQPMALAGDAKLITPMTMENIREAIITRALASVEEVDALVRQLYAYAEDPTTLAGMPRVVQTWGSKAR